VRTRDHRVRPLQARQEWDAIAEAMAGLLDRLATDSAVDRSEEPA
jgi:hypothetical protein